MNKWRCDHPSTEIATINNFITVAVDEVTDTGFFKLLIKHVRGFHGRGFVPQVNYYTENRGEHIGEVGSTHYGESEENYAQAVEEGRRLLQQHIVERDRKFWCERWKQATPFDQLTVILMSMEGHMDNHKNAIGGDRPLEAIDEHIAELKVLEHFLRKGCWN